ncbi:thioredoxin domain-containing protein 5 [Trichonephila clavata]|uniref:Thioredoxin domain-containing protein 5 n=1 Tax=Trichonephila clavata TaxID=2740835 RepID=A0A8X6L1G8_TRICU|nr:thioredoxin domain-containing protein 5 [Trichonephila clavata]
MTNPHFVNFYAPWCGYCKRLKPVWDELAEKYNSLSSHSTLIIAKVDCTVETPICADEGISGYPSLVYYDIGIKKGVKYQGKRDLVGLEDFISNFQGEKKIDVSPGNTNTKTKLKNGALELTDENFQNTVNWGLHFVKFYAPWCGHCQKMARAWEELAENLQYDKSVTISKIDCTENKKTCSEFEVKGYPTLLWIVNGKKIEKYQGTRDLDGFKKFITEMKAAHKETLEHEEGRIPEPKEEPNLVVELSKDNFENVIAQGISFVKFFVPWCGHCKRLEPVWNNLAIKYSSNPKIKIAKVDCTKEERLCGEHKIAGYPTLFIFREGKFITEYHGERKLENLHSFVLDYIQHTEL